MDKIKVSVIVPVYNVEEYIEECIESIVNQTLKEIEIIIVNDGTKDNSMKKIEKYLSDSRIIVINKENGGISSARNAGLKIARGEYISFIDSDDFIELTMLGDLYNNSEESEVVFSNIIFYDNITKEKSYNKEKAIVINSNAGKKNFIFNLTMNVVWNKLYRKDYLEKINLKFIEGIIYEDVNFSVEILFLAKKVKYIDKFHYNYRVNRKGSVITDTKSKRKKEKNLFNLLIINSFEKIINELEKFEKKYKYELNSFEKITLNILEMEYKIRALKEKGENCLEKKEFKNFENVLKENWNLLSVIEKEEMKKEIDKILKSKIAIDINIFDLFWWKNKIFTKKSLRRIIKEKIKGIF